MKPFSLLTFCLTIYFIPKCSYGAISVKSLILGDHHHNVSVQNCDSNSGVKYKTYFEDSKRIYGDISETCLPQHEACGWPKDEHRNPNLPLFVLTIGVEGAGHHMWTEKLRFLFDCVWITGPHYNHKNGQ